ncbi:MAG: CtsR family transcriptional regulator [Clostridia bacterium]|nr:CtsR family transcriptional regulator [Clostridia bacterium]
MSISNEIARMLIAMLDETGRAEIQRNELAEQLGCVPSQINYVISSRFTPENGYTVESRRGGGGYIKITRINYSAKEQMLMHIINSIGDSIGEQSARAIVINLNHSEILSAEKAKLIIAALNDNCYKSVPVEYRGRIRAAVFKQMLLASR